jgi:hypothetical protein
LGTAVKARIAVSFDAINFILGLGYVMGLRSSMILCAGGIAATAKVRDPVSVEVAHRNGFRIVPRSRIRGVQEAEPSARCCWYPGTTHPNSTHPTEV